MVKCSEGWSLRAALKRKIFWFLEDRPDQKWPKSGTLAVHILHTTGNFSPIGMAVGGGLSKPFTPKGGGGVSAI